MNQTIEQRVADLVEPMVSEKGLELVDVEYIKEGAHWYLRLFIDKEGGVDLDDCTEVSHAVSELLDQQDPISQAYMLEVSSPGLERPLKKEEDFKRFQGQLVTVRLDKPYNGFNEFTGYLIGLIENQIVLEYEGEQISIPQTLNPKTNLTYEF